MVLLCDDNPRVFYTGVFFRLLCCSIDDLSLSASSAFCGFPASLLRLAGHLMLFLHLQLVCPAHDMHDMKAGG